MKVEAADARAAAGFSPESESTRRWFRFALVVHTGYDHALQRARAEPQEDAGIERQPRPQAVRVGAQIADRRLPSPLPICRSKVTFHDWTRGELMSGSIAPNAPYGMNSVFAFVTIGCGSPPNCRYGIVEQPGRILDSVRLPNGGAVRVDDVVFRRREVVGEPVRGAHRRAAVAVHVPGKTHARREVQPLLVLAALPVRETRVARVDQPGGRVHEHRALHVVPEVVQAEVETAPFSTFCPKYGSQRRPALTRHPAASLARCPARRRRGSTDPSAESPGPPCSMRATRPMRKSAMPRAEQLSR